MKEHSRSLLTEGICFLLPVTETTDRGDVTSTSHHMTATGGHPGLMSGLLSIQLTGNHSHLSVPTEGCFSSSATDPGGSGVWTYGIHCVAVTADGANRSTRER